MEKTKFTKREVFEALRTMVEGVEAVGEIPADAVIEILDKQVAQLDKKAETAKIKAAEKRAAGDSLRTAVKAVLTEELQTADEILDQLEGENLTRSKIVARMTQLIKSNEAMKEQIKDEESGRKIMAYRIFKN